MPFSTFSSTFSFILALHIMYKTCHQETRPKAILKKKIYPMDNSDLHFEKPQTPNTNLFCKSKFLTIFCYLLVIILLLFASNTNPTMSNPNNSKQEGKSASNPRRTLMDHFSRSSSTLRARRPDPAPSPPDSNATCPLSDSKKVHFTKLVTKTVHFVTKKACLSQH